MELYPETVLQRRDRLEQIINPVPGIQVGNYVENRGIDLYRLAKEKGLKGIIAKRKTSTYRSGKRSPDWLKMVGAQAKYGIETYAAFGRIF